MEKIWLSLAHPSGREEKYIKEAFDGNWITTAGPNITGFEVELAKYVGINNVVALSSGTAALHLALILLNVSKDDIVLCQSLTFAASANPIVYQGATPAFIDSENVTWNICPNALEDALKHFISIGKKPKAVIGVHLYGMPCMIDEILYLSEKYEVPFIEDAAEALGSMYKGRKAGSFGKMSIFSFNGNKIITTSGGGALFSNNEELINKARFLATQARDHAVHYEHSEIGYNYRMSNVCAGIGRGQLEVIDARVSQRRSNYRFYHEKLSNIPGISFQNEPEDFFSNRWLTTITIDPLTAWTSSEEIRQHLELHNIESRPIWKPMHLQPVFKKAMYFGGNISQNLFKNGLCLPSGSSLSTHNLERIQQEIRSCLQTGHKKASDRN
ncbi:aminotransferase class I/II-fold pyridoxal phosphate-dependent enzyme [Dyadobacter sp. CY312]|nr:aminotransferase class I/II-fold pyridoxal phosphate-dependent enzyme [Dyadobacter sp. CY312]